MLLSLDKSRGFSESSVKWGSGFDSPLLLTAPHCPPPELPARPTDKMFTSLLKLKRPRDVPKATWGSVAEPGLGPKPPDPGELSRDPLLPRCL